MLKIIHVEDDHLLADQVEQEIAREIPTAKIDRIRTEFEFRERMHELIAEPPGVVILDIMLRWTDSAPSMPTRPPDVEKSGRFRAGIRCLELLRKQNSNVPVILFTVLEKTDLKLELEGNQALHVVKSDDLSQLCRTIKQIAAVES